MRRRPSARLLVLDSESRVLLFRFVFSRGALAGQSYWATPGGGLEHEETFEQAAIRELHEETGILVDRVPPHVGEREFVLHLPNGEHVIAEERFFLIRAPNSTVSRDGWSAHEIEVMAEHKWWSVDELAQADETIWPDDLPGMLSAALAQH